MTAWSRWLKSYIMQFFYCSYYNKFFNIKDEKKLYTDKQYEIIKKVRNHYYLDLEELKLLKTFSKEQLIEIIEIININTIRMNDLINYLEV